MLIIQILQEVRLQDRRKLAELSEKTAGSGKSLTLELGGKSPFIVFEDADLDSAVEGLVDAALVQSRSSMLCWIQAFNSREY